MKKVSVLGLLAILLTVSTAARAEHSRLDWGNIEIPISLNGQLGFVEEHKALQFTVAEKLVKVEVIFDDPPLLSYKFNYIAVAVTVDNYTLQLVTSVGDGFPDHPRLRTIRLYDKTGRTDYPIFEGAPDKLVHKLEQNFPALKDKIKFATAIGGTEGKWYQGGEESQPTTYQIEIDGVPFRFTHLAYFDPRLGDMSWSVAPEIYFYPVSLSFSHFTIWFEGAEGKERVDYLTAQHPGSITEGRSVRK